MKKNVKNIVDDLDDKPLATMIIEQYQKINSEYKEANDSLKKANRLIGIVAIILAIAFAVETTYIIIYWDSMHPNAGMIREDNINH